VKKYIYLFCFFIFINLTAQNEINYFTKINFENHIIEETSQFVCFISYSIPYNQLIFIKENERFLSGLSISFEIFDRAGFIKREFSDVSVTIDDYDLSGSEYLKLNGFAKINLDMEKYSIKPFISLNNTNLTLPCLPFEIDLSTKKDSILFSPISVSKMNSGLVLLNENNKIKYEDDNSSLLFLLNSQSDSINIEIKQGNKTVFDKMVVPKLLGSLKYKLFNSLIFLQNDTSSIGYKTLLLNNVNKFLDEGDFVVELKTKTKFLKFNLKSEWINKPKSLSYPEIVISALKIILPKDSVYLLNRVKEEEFYKKVKDIFNKNFPSKNRFNSRFYEFFKRVDFVETNFRSLKSKLGVESDRGVIYLKYGEPDNIDRDYKARDDISEIWTYKALNKVFTFIDKTGTGDYLMVQ